jgi:hypothetical protein
LKEGKKRFVDLGHYYNTPSILECLALHYEDDIAFVRIRRNRHDIAHSFASSFMTPCYGNEEGDDERHPVLSYCPIKRKVNDNDNPPVPLHVETNTWMKFNAFQKFLWLADDLEMRWVYFQKYFPNSHYVDISWSDPDELVGGIIDVAKALCGAATSYSTNSVETKKKNHVSHNENTRDCGMQLRSDLGYRRHVGYSAEQCKILFDGKNKLRFHFKECKESKEELKSIVEEEGLSLENFDWEWEEE